MKQIYYKTSDGKIINLISEPYMMLTDTELFDYAWENVTQGEVFPKIVAMRKTIISPSFSIRISGSSKQDLMDNVESLIGDFDADVYKMQMGRLYVGDYYRECFIQAATMTKIFETTSTTIQFNALSDNADWTKVETIQIESQAGSSLIQSIADNVSYSVSNNSSSLDIKQNSDHTMQVAWNNLSSGGYMTIDLGQVYSIEGINGLVIPKSDSLAVAEIEISVAETKNNYSVIDTIIQENYYGDDIEWNDNTTRNVRWIKIKQKAQRQDFSINCSAFGIYPTDAGRNYVIKKAHRVLNDCTELTDNMYQVSGTSGNITFSKPFLRISRVYMDLMGGGTGHSGFSVAYRSNGGSWTVLASSVTSVDWEGEIYCDELMISLPQGVTYFNHFGIMGIEREFITNESYAPSDCVIRFYGQDSTPVLTIADNSYGADVEIEDGYYLEIDTKNKTVRLYDEETGEYENKFANRIETTFEKLPAGESEVVWEEWKTLEIEIIEERSQPKWN